MVRERLCPKAQLPKLYLFGHGEAGDNGHSHIDLHKAFDDLDIITSMQAVYVPADDYTDPAPVTTFAHLDATISLERSIVEMGIFPAVDPLTSTSRILDGEVDHLPEQAFMLCGSIRGARQSLMGRRRA